MTVPSDTAPLTSGAGMPLLGFGTWQLRGDAAHRATAEALAAGYRHVDTATMYGNEREVGRAVREAGGAFVTTKLPPDHAGRERSTLERSLELLGLDAVDLWLVHWPPADPVAVWEAFLAARSEGLARDVGVSNFSLDQVDELERATGVRPAVNQVPWSPLRFDRALLDGHRERGVVLEGYSGLKGGVLDRPEVRAVAGRLGRTPAQVVLRWHLEHGVVAIPKSSSPERIRANADLGFRLDPDDVAALDALAA
jgi:2,5-diketo-D-gluconate reductase A